MKQGCFLPAQLDRWYLSTGKGDTGRRQTLVIFEMNIEKLYYSVWPRDGMCVTQVSINEYLR